LEGTRAWACRRTGKIYLQSEFSDFGEMNDELPDDVEDDEKYLEIPNKRELGLGKLPALEFGREFLAEQALREWCKANSIEVAD
jgi:hypothetical protein